MRYSFLFVALALPFTSLAAEGKDDETLYKNAHERCFTTFYTPLRDVGRAPVEELCDCLEGKLRELKIVPGENSAFEESFGPSNTDATPEAYNRCMAPFFKKADAILKANKLKKMQSGGAKAPEPSAKPADEEAAPAPAPQAEPGEASPIAPGDVDGMDDSDNFPDEHIQK